MKTCRVRCAIFFYNTLKKWHFLFFIALSACVQQPVYPPAMPLDMPPPAKKGGAIYQAGYGMRLYDDKVAFRIGDIITIRLEESTRGEYRAKTKTDKKAQLNYPAPVLFGKTIPDLALQTNTQQTFDSKGDSDQSDRLQGTMSVTVMQVLSNGNLMVQGETWLTMNQGQKYMRIRGIIRQVDVDPDNTVSSQRIADAHITYGAAGQSGYATKGGLVTRLFNRFALY